MGHDEGWGCSASGGGSAVAAPGPQHAGLHHDPPRDGAAVVVAGPAAAASLARTTVAAAGPGAGISDAGGVVVGIAAQPIPYLPLLSKKDGDSGPGEGSARTRVVQILYLSGPLSSSSSAAGPAPTEAPADAAAPPGTESAASAAGPGAGAEQPALNVRARMPLLLSLDVCSNFLSPPETITQNVTTLAPTSLHHFSQDTIGGGPNSGGGSASGGGGVGSVGAGELIVLGPASTERWSNLPSEHWYPSARPIPSAGGWWAGPNKRGPWTVPKHVPTRGEKKDGGKGSVSAETVERVVDVITNTNKILNDDMSSYAGRAIRCYVQHGVFLREEDPKKFAVSAKWVVSLLRDSRMSGHLTAVHNDFSKLDLDDFNARSLVDQATKRTKEKTQMRSIVKYYKPRGGCTSFADKYLYVLDKEDAQAAKKAQAAKDAQVARDAKAKAERDAQAAKDAQTARDAQAAKDAQAAIEAQAAKNAQAAKDAQATIEAQAAKDAQTARDAQAAKDAQAAIEAQAAKDAQTARDAQAAKDAQAAIEAQAAKDAQTARDAQAAKDAQAAIEAQAAKNAQAAKDAQAAKKAQAAKDAQVARDAKAASDAKAERDAQVARAPPQEADIQAAEAIPAGASEGGASGDRTSGNRTGGRQSGGHMQLRQSMNGSTGSMNGLTASKKGASRVGSAKPAPKGASSIGSGKTAPKGGSLVGSAKTAPKGATGGDLPRHVIVRMARNAIVSKVKSKYYDKLYIGAFPSTPLSNWDGKLVIPAYTDYDVSVNTEDMSPVILEGVKGTYNDPKKVVNMYQSGFLMVKNRDGTIYRAPDKTIKKAIANNIQQTMKSILVEAGLESKYAEKMEGVKLHIRVLREVVRKHTKRHKGFSEFGAAAAPETSDGDESSGETTETDHHSSEEDDSSDYVDEDSSAGNNRKRAREGRSDGASGGGSSSVHDQEAVTSKKNRPGPGPGGSRIRGLTGVAEFKLEGATQEAWAQGTLCFILGVECMCFAFSVFDLFFIVI